MNYSFNGYQCRHRIEAVSCGSLVYVRNLKCGSTGYYNFFKGYMRWPEINYMDIDWDQQKVFGHIMNPHIRRCKGLAEYLEMSSLISLYYENPNFQEMVRGLPCADQHSMSYYDTFGSQVERIHWIPIYGNYDETHAMTRNFMRQHNIQTFDIIDPEFNYHEGSKEKKAVARDLLDYWYEHHQNLDIVKLYLEKDRRLWNNALNAENI